MTRSSPTELNSFSPVLVKSPSARAHHWAKHHLISALTESAVTSEKRIEESNLRAFIQSYLQLEPIRKRGRTTPYNTQQRCQDRVGAHWRGFEINLARFGSDMTDLLLLTSVCAPCPWHSLAVLLAVYVLHRGWPMCDRSICVSRIYTD